MGRIDQRKDPVWKIELVVGHFGHDYLVYATHVSTSERYKNFEWVRLIDQNLTTTHEWLFASYLWDITINHTLVIFVVVGSQPRQNYNIEPTIFASIILLELWLV